MSPRIRMLLQLLNKVLHRPLSPALNADGATVRSIAQSNPAQSASHTHTPVTQTHTGTLILLIIMQGLNRSYMLDVWSEGCIHLPMGLHSPTRTPLQLAVYWVFQLH